MNRRGFAVGLPALLALVKASASQGRGALRSKPAEALRTLTSGTFKPGEGRSTQEKRISYPYLSGLLTAGNIRLEMHRTIQKAGAEHEPAGTHKHNEIWCVQQGVASLHINGIEHRMEAGEVGLVCAGDEHWIKNAGEGELVYFVIAVGPPE